METPGECTFEFLPRPFSDSIASVNNAESTPTLAPLLLVGLYQERRLPPRTCTRMHPLQHLASPPVLNQVPITTILRVLRVHIRRNRGYRGLWKRKPAVGFFL